MINMDFEERLQLLDLKNKVIVSSEKLILEEKIEDGKANLVCDIGSVIKALFAEELKDNFFENDNSVVVHIRHIREKLEDKVKNSQYIKTIWGVGYKIEKDI